MRLETPDKIRDLQRKLYLKAKREPRFRFYLLQDKVWREDIVQHAYRLVRANGGAPGIDGATFQSIESGEGEAQFLSKLRQELKEKTYRPQAVRRVYIPKADGRRRPLGIPTIRDRVAQMAMKIVIEPIFEADFEDCSFGFRPKRDAHQAVGAIRQGPAEAATQRRVWIPELADGSTLSGVGPVQNSAPCSLWAHSYALR